MKKVIVALLTFAVLLSVFVVPATAATTKADLLAEAAKSPIYKYVKASVENAARTIDITEEQAQQLMPLVKEAVSIVPKDNGPTASNSATQRFYTEAQVNQMVSIIDRACKILGFTYAFDSAKKVKGTLHHADDIVFDVYDKSGKLIFQYDGDQVEDTSAAPVVTTEAWLAIGAGVATLALAGVTFVAKKRFCA